MPSESSQSTDSTVSAATPTGPRRVVLFYRREILTDEEVLQTLEQRLTQEGFSVLVDRRVSLGVDWARAIEQTIRSADAVVPLLSPASVQSEMLALEVEIAHEAAQQQQGRPHVVPVFLDYDDPLPEPLASILDPKHAVVWYGPQDNERLVSELTQALRHLPVPQPAAPVVPTKGLRILPRPAARPRPVAPTPVPTPTAATWLAPLEPVGGAVPLHSEFYLERAADAELRSAINRFDSTVLIKGARQIGKTSLLARGLQYGRERGGKAALTDFQKFNAVHLESIATFYLSLAESLADQLDLAVLPADVWDERRGPNVNFERFVRREVLAKLNSPLLWGLDEADRLFSCSFGSEVFGLFRSWHNERALDPNGPWAGLTLVISYATEAHLFITDMNQSPFNVGTRIALDDFSAEQVAELNRRHGSPLKTPEELARFTRLVGGQPYLVRVGLYEMATHKIALPTFEAQADRDDGLFGDHLRRILVLLAKDPALTDIVRGVLKGQPCPTPESFYRLRSSGVMSGNTQTDVRPRCQLYASYLSRHLL
ncbi:MAG: AAA-like domain-containing protein [Verrucomicrobia bacterium]|nr:AAA-like domain-containing protein [Verrucomicrobiota bacterium]